MDDTLGDRMKDYESVSRPFLTKRVPVVVRVDGKAFHTFTRQFDRPFDKRIMDAMETAARKTAEEMQGFKLGYVQSDEASFLLTDYEDVKTQGWFNYNMNKLVSLTSSYMTVYFYRAILPHLTPMSIPVFDARAFNVPENDVANYFLWRRKDWDRNSIAMYAQANFSHKELHGKKRQDMHDMLHNIGKNWTTDLTDRAKNGTFIYNKNGVVFSDYSVQPSFDSVSQLVDDVLRKEVVVE